MNPRRFHLLFVVLALIVCSLIGCQKSEDERGPQPMTFAVEADQLGEAVALEAQGVQFQPPTGWVPLGVGQVDSVEQALPLDDSLAFRPLHVFLDEATGSVLSVATFKFDGGRSFEEQMRGYSAVLADRFAGDSLRQTQFLKDDLHIAQFLVQPEGLVNFKLVFEAEPDGLLQFDYVVPRAQYPREVKAIESSIGSIRRIP